MLQEAANRFASAQQVKVEPSDFVRTGMYSPVRDKYPDGTELTIAELLRYTICESDGSASDVLNNLDVRHLNFLQEGHDTARTADE